jgi:hypothetical protein
MPYGIFHRSATSRTLPLETDPYQDVYFRLVKAASRGSSKCPRLPMTIAPQSRIISPEQALHMTESTEVRRSQIRWIGRVGCDCHRVPGHELLRNGRFVGTYVVSMDY